jgi:hypothetical protein
MPTFLTDLHAQGGPTYVTKWPCMASGRRIKQQVPAFNVQQSQVNSNNQTRWNGTIKAFYDWGHIPVDSPLELYPPSSTLFFPASPPFGLYNSIQVATLTGVGVTDATARAAHRLNEIRKPLGEVAGDGDPTLPEPDGPHLHPETYNPGFTLPPTGVFPYQIAVNGHPSGSRLRSKGTFGQPVGNNSFGWEVQSQQNPTTGRTGVDLNPHLYPWGDWLGPRGQTPHGGWVTYGLFGPHGTDESQSYEIYWLTPILYKVHDRAILHLTLQNGSYSEGYASIQMYKDNTDAVISGPWGGPIPNPWHDDDNWIALHNELNGAAVRVRLEWDTPAANGPPGTYFYRLATGSIVTGDFADVWDTWEWRKEYRLDRITTGQGFLKEIEYAQVFPPMSPHKFTEVTEIETRNLLREMAGGERLPPAIGYKTSEDKRLRKKKVAEYGL